MEKVPSKICTSAKRPCPRPSHSRCWSRHVPHTFEQIHPSHLIAHESRQITAFALNRMDVSQREGLYPPPPGASEILGVEFAGHITALGPNTSSSTWAIGDQVLGLVSGVSLSSATSEREPDAGRLKASFFNPRPLALDAILGGFRALMRSSSPYLKRKFFASHRNCHGQRRPASQRRSSQASPKLVLCALLGSTLNAAPEAFQALVLVGDIKRGDDVLVHAAASGVGIAAIQLARFYGA